MSKLSYKKCKLLVKRHIATILQSGVKIHNISWTGEQYHAYVVCIFEQTQANALHTAPSLALSMATKVINNAARLYSLSSTLHVFKVIARFGISLEELPRQDEKIRALKFHELE